MSGKSRSKSEKAFDYETQLAKTREDIQLANTRLAELFKESKRSSSRDKQSSSEDPKKKKKKKRKSKEEEKKVAQECVESRDKHTHKKRSKKKSKRESERQEDMGREEEDSGREEEDSGREEEDIERQEEDIERQEEDITGQEEEDITGQEEDITGQEEDIGGQEEEDSGSEEKESSEMNVDKVFEKPLRMVETINSWLIKIPFNVGRQDTQENKQLVSMQMFLKKSKKQIELSDKQNGNKRDRERDDSHAECSYEDPHDFGEGSHDSGACSHDFGESSHCLRCNLPNFSAVTPAVNEENPYFNQAFAQGSTFLNQEWHEAQRFLTDYSMNSLQAMLYIYVGNIPKFICLKDSLEEIDERVPANIIVTEFVEENETVTFRCNVRTISATAFEWYKYKKDRENEVIKEEIYEDILPYYFAFSQLCFEKFEDKHQGEYHCKVSCGDASLDLSVKVFLSMLDYYGQLKSSCNILSLSNTIKTSFTTFKPSSTVGIGSYEDLSQTSTSDDEHEDDTSSDEVDYDFSDTYKYESPIYEMYKAKFKTESSSESAMYKQIISDLEPIEGAVSLWITGLSTETRGLPLMELFQYQGELHDVTIVEDLKLSPPKRYAYIRMATKDGARNCINLSTELNIDDHYLTVKKCGKHDERAVKKCVQEAILENIILDLEDERNDWKVFSRHNKVKLLHKDVSSLFHSNWLSDKVIDFYLQLIVERSKQQNLPSVYAFSTSFYATLQKGYSFVTSWTNKIDIFSYDIIMMPVVSDAHRGIAVIDFRLMKIKLYDSLNILNSCFVTLRDYLISESVDKKGKNIDLTEWSYDNVESIPKLTEDTSYDCGVFLLKYAECIAKDVTEMTFQPAKTFTYRLQIAYEIYKKQVL